MLAVYILFGLFGFALGSVLSFFLVKLLIQATEYFKLKNIKIKSELKIKDDQFNKEVKAKQFN